jgi:hypothetical protein
MSRRNLRVLAEIEDLPIRVQAQAMVRVVAAALPVEESEHSLLILLSIPATITTALIQHSLCSFSPCQRLNFPGHEFKHQSRGEVQEDVECAGHLSRSSLES